MEWNAIHWAPKDGTLIMVWDESARRPLIIRADDLLAKPVWLSAVTHWMPLPPPPSTDSK